MDVLSDKWTKRFLELAYLVSTWSKDTSTQVGAFITDLDGNPKSFGYNGIPRGVDDNVVERMIKPVKYYYCEHAERNAIYQAPGDLKGCIMYSTHHPCSDCARAIIQKGFKAIVVDAKHSNSGSSKFSIDWNENITHARTMLMEAGIEIIEINIDKECQMNTKDYVDFVEGKLSKESTNFNDYIARLVELNGKGVPIHQLDTAAQGMSAEAGEFEEIVKKIKYQGKEYTEENIFHLKRELGDVLFYVSVACVALGVSFEEVMAMNFEKLEKRYPDGFQVQKSEVRAENDI